MDATTRRGFLRTAGTLAAAPLAARLLTACGDSAKLLSAICPTEPQDTGGVAFVPDAVRPVYYGYRDVTTDAGTAVRLLYPTYATRAENAPLLKVCLPRWPVVLFLHGQGPCQSQDGPASTYYQRWVPMLHTLARIGYVVVIPRLPQAGPPAGDNPADVRIARGALQWLRNSWDEREWLALPEALAVVGHSFGGLVAARVAAVEPCMAFASLGVDWSGEEDLPGLLGRVRVPALVMTGTGDVFAQGRDRLPTLPGETCFVAYGNGTHFDFLRDDPECSEERGPCARERVTGDLLALFVARHVPAVGARAKVPIDLTIPPADLTPAERSFAGTQHLASLRRPQLFCVTEIAWRAGPDEAVERRMLFA